MSRKSFLTDPDARRERAFGLLCMLVLAANVFSGVLMLLAVSMLES